MDASRNHGNCWNATNNSWSSMISQNPWGDTLVTSAGEVLRPSASDFMKMLLDQIPGLCQLLGLQPVVGVKRDHWFNPELRLTRRMLDMHMGSRLLAREEIEAIATDPENRRTHATKNIPVAKPQFNIAPQTTVPRTVRVVSHVSAEAASRSTV